MSATATRRKKTTKLDTGHHDRRLATRLANDPEFAAEFERQRRAIDAIDVIIRRLDELRADLGVSKAELARLIDKNPASVRRLLTAAGNPELGTVVAMADALDADLVLVARKKSRRRAVAAS